MSKKKSPSKPKAVKAAKVKPAKVAKAAPEKVAREQRNGVTRPGAETLCGKVWSALDALKAKDAEITFEALREVVDNNCADATIKTQRQRWKTFHA
jgi:hypothetical protein